MTAHIRISAKHLSSLSTTALMLMAHTALATPAPAPSAPAAAPAESDDTGSAIIVTGTRARGITQAESPTPIKVLDSSALTKVGQPSVTQELAQLIPSFSAQTFGGDASNLTLSARLRGLSPNHTLVLVNGKRRHGTANFSISGGAYAGGAAPDLDLISPESIDHIEVLEQGAAAQYGSDAIGGVINIILKNKSEGGTLDGTGGSYYNTGGLTGAVGLNLGTKLGENGFLNITAFHRYHDYSVTSGLDKRVVDANGTLLSSLSTAQKALYGSLPGYPNVNPITGDARTHLTNLQYNAGYDLGDVQLYSFGSYSRKVANSQQNVRLPDRIIASSTLGVAGTLGSSDALLYSSTGFIPLIGIKEDDFSFTGGAKGQLAGFNFDLSGTWGQDHDDVYTLNSANAQLFINTHTTPSNFHDGSWRAVEWTLNADFNRDIDLGLAKPLTFAFGAEYRKNIYAITAGDPASYQLGGAQAYPGFTPTDAGDHNRHNIALYADITAHPTAKWLIEPAVRWEHYSDFGDTTTWKVTSRYDVSPAFGLRGTVNTGFRAPSLLEEYYSATNLSPTTATVVLPANSAAAKFLGFQNLKPEKSTNYSLGLVLRPAPRLTFTLDVYQIKIRDRILGTSTLYGTGGSVNYPLVTQAIALNGNLLDPTVSVTGVSTYTNAADTRTRGVDVVASYASDFHSLGHVTWTLAGTYNKTRATKIYSASSVIPVSSTFSATAQSTLESSTPTLKVITGADWTLGKLDLNLRGTYYSATRTYVTPGTGLYLQRVPNAYIVDLDLGYQLFKGLRLAIGANNLFNIKPPYSDPNQTGGSIWRTPITTAPYGINGGYYYGKVTVNF
ncbi:TonB-dependent receptor plug domain-containing protein [Novosphingobium terrae]|uniref:TonB-dependent receptor plug domain-containing protein n=1 Tax=Novosphingobium terrae TaxID=2726189 RepID=UPI00197DA134|nr:TonB-dependent receptor [Novosphingobium terrae]